MKTILHLIDTSGPGGAETVFLNLVDAFDSGEFRSLSLVAEGSWVQGALSERGHHVETCRTRGSFNMTYLRRIARLVRTEKVDLVQAHLPGPSIYAGIVSLMTGVPLVSALHGSVDFGDEGSLRRIKLAAINRGSSRIVAVSKHLRQELEDRVGLNRNKLEVIYNGVDLAGFGDRSSASIRDELDLPADAFVICSVGNIRPAKGYDVLISAAAKLRDLTPEVYFVVAGQPKDGLFEDLLSLRERSEVTSRVHFLGYREDAAAILAGSDLFLLPSTSEGFSISTIEAMAAGVPVLATRSGGPQEIIDDGVDGRLVDPGDAHDMARAIRALVASPELRRTMSSRAQMTVARRFSLATMTDQYRTLYERLSGGDS